MVCDRTALCAEPRIREDLISSQVHLPQNLVDGLADQGLTSREDLRLLLTLDLDLKHILEDAKLVS